MSYSVRWSRPATKQLLRLPRKQQAIIVSWVAKNLEGCQNPREVGDGKRIQGSRAGWRWRVGTYRILAALHDDVLEVKVVRVAKRQDAYKNLPNL